ncbi:MAG: hemin-degrading factor [Gammaproteobacteria bacterium]|nr:MAG: hemin-degrading factor [Gammaproteobacteria bacterium]
MNTTPPNELKKSWMELKAASPNIRIRNAAETLGVSEYELLLTGVDVNLTHLEARHGELLQALEGVGSVMALTRNDLAVHEKHGTYTNFKVTGKGAMGICLGAIDLRVFLNRWRHAVAVTDTGGKQTRHSIQFFDAQGNALHKVYQTEATNQSAWENLIRSFTAGDQEPQFQSQPIEPEQTDSEKTESGQLPTREAVREEWQSLKDVHHFNAMLKRLGIDRYQALQLVGEDYAKQLPIESAEKTLQMAQQQGLPIMVFVGNRGLVQIHTGVIGKVLRTGPWFNVLDPDFNLHLNTEAIYSVWSVRRHTSDGIVTSVEIYSRTKELITTLFGERKPGQPESEQWQKLIKEMEKEMDS